ncbi:MAG: hypothetical protein ACXVCK_08880, partial [Bdellovibrionota bacterium]
MQFSRFVTRAIFLPAIFAAGVVRAAEVAPDGAAAPATVCASRAAAVENGFHVAGHPNNPVATADVANLCQASKQMLLNRVTLPQVGTVSLCEFTYRNLAEASHSLNELVKSTCEKTSSLSDTCDKNPAHCKTDYSEMLEKAKTARQSERQLLELLQKIQPKAQWLQSKNGQELNAKYEAYAHKLHDSLDPEYVKGPAAASVAKALDKKDNVAAADAGAPNLGAAWKIMTGSEFGAPVNRDKSRAFQELKLSTETAKQAREYAESQITEHKAALAQLDQKVGTLEARAKGAGAPGSGGREKSGSVAAAARVKAGGPGGAQGAGGAQPQAAGGSAGGGGAGMDQVSKLAEQAMKMAAQAQQGQKSSGAPAAPSMAPAAAPAAAAPASTPAKQPTSYSLLEPTIAAGGSASIAPNTSASTAPTSQQGGTQNLANNDSGDHSASQGLGPAASVGRMLSSGSAASAAAAS